MTHPNPLTVAFRQPKIYMKLPSESKFWEFGSIELPVTGDLPVMSMTGKDEIILKTADALMNGAATVEMLQSCIPSIKNAWKMPRIDLDALLIGVRLATYGDKLDVEIKCPKCGDVSPYEIDLHYMMTNIKLPDYDNAVEINGLLVNFKPQNYEQYNKSNLESFEQKRLVAQLANPAIPEEERAKGMREIVKRVTEINVIQIADNIESIIAGDTKVSDRALIEDFLKNTDLETFTKIKNKINELNASYKMPSMHIRCSNCNHEFESNIDLDPVTFFAPSS
jgi:DNA-directed RNA polymerase subunit RPC12/RpoP